MSDSSRGSQLSAARVVTVVSSTWGRESHELFDFEAKGADLQTTALTARTSVTAVRRGSDVRLVRQGEAPEGCDGLLQVIERKGVFYADRAAPSSGSKKLWAVVRDMEPRGYRLRQGDMIRLGRLKFRVRQLVAEGSAAPDLGAQDLCSACQVCPAAQDG
eukprot:SRR837773.23871.p3 GENE.SRR837773.23871~~SRR837773.23871.p3  ORF type:complete len:176 (+),score=55.32 SRR837773.23871:50-529(+)